MIVPTSLSPHWGHLATRRRTGSRVTEILLQVHSQPRSVNSLCRGAARAQPPWAPGKHQEHSLEHLALKGVDSLQCPHCLFLDRQTGPPATQQTDKPRAQAWAPLGPSPCGHPSQDPDHVSMCWCWMPATEHERNKDFVLTGPTFQVVARQATETAHGICQMLGKKLSQVKKTENHARDM